MLSVDVVEDICHETEAVTALMRRDPGAVPAAQLMVVAGMWLDLASAAFGDCVVGNALTRMADETAEMVADKQP